ncbi:hypothetical protein [Natrialbaceae archaeon AArc-T1-2]|uniref:hypothetical protein n=1 Tax=Natrialbaceae archaeon AArc-T1-2 TaxID=3053904 RepID=UPI00255B071F|nr:hypothetical protein [Natrialbaceae archaeon AArc-T1-2]WIV66803.1 hypothetical protein QQ977_14075 [Natrialbaceae archaeon AArc-T1-2]
MDRDELAAALRSGDADRVNRALDDLNETDIEDRMPLFEAVIDDLEAIYADSDDGYVRQSVVRATKEFTMGVYVLSALEDAPARRLEDADREDVRRWTDECCGFLLEALQDEDGRVRRAGNRALKDVFRAYGANGDEETLSALVAELEALAADAEGSKREHLLEASENAKRFGSGGLLF